MGPLLFLIYINDLPEGLITNAKLFADDTSLFSVVRDIAASTEELNSDPRNIRKSAYQWKIIFNPDLTKQVQEVTFGRKLNKPVHRKLTLNNSQVSQTESQKHFGLILGNKLNFSEHLKGVLDKTSKTIGLIRKFQPILPRFSLLTIYKTFVRPHLDYRDIIYDQTYNVSFHRKLESILFYKIIINQSPSYLFDYIPSTVGIYNTRNATHVSRMKSKHTFFKNSYIPSTITEQIRLTYS